MKNLSKRLLVNKLQVKKEMLEVINKEIEDKKIHNYGHSLYQCKHMIIGEITMLEELINKLY